jgi:hypothetical protein
VAVKTSLVRLKGICFTVRACKRSSTYIERYIFELRNFRGFTEVSLRSCKYGGATLLDWSLLEQREAALVYLWMGRGVVV